MSENQNVPGGAPGEPEGGPSQAGTLSRQEAPAVAPTPPAGTEGGRAPRGRAALAGGALALLVVGGVGGFAVGQATAGTGTATTPQSGTGPGGPGQGGQAPDGELGTPPGMGAGGGFGPPPDAGGGGTAPAGTGTGTT